MAKAPTLPCNTIYKAPHFCSLSEMQCWAWHCYKNAVNTKEKYCKIKTDAEFHAKICKKKSCGYLKYKVYFEKE